MPPFALLNAMLHLLPSLPAAEADIKAALSQHWSNDIVQDFVQAVHDVDRIVSEVAASMTQPVEQPLVAEPVTATASLTGQPA